MVTSMDDIFSELNPETLFRAEKKYSAKIEKKNITVENDEISFSRFTGLEEKVYRLLNRDGVDIDHIIRDLGERTDKVLEAVTTLQIEGIADRVGNRVFLN